MSEIDQGQTQDATQGQTTETNPPPQVIVQQAVIKGSMLGGVLLVLFVIGAVLVYLLTGAAGWDNDSIRIISAMCVGPLLGLAVFGAWVLIQRGKSAHG
ncbi:MAG: hypothetical protein DPW16_07510 [Chloroflexi bacterium]|nr:hypothetical protein [Chloroflexota bacterium]